MALSRVRRAVSDASRRPALLVLCGLVGAAEAATWLLVLPVLAGAPTVVVLGLVLAQRTALIGLLAALLPGMYAAARDEPGDGEESESARSVRRALQVSIDRADAAAPRLFVSLAVSRIVATGLALAVALVLIGALGVLDTAVVWTDAYVGIGTDRALLASLGVSGAIVLPSLLARGAVGLHDLAAIDGEHPPVEAPLWSLRSWRSRPRALLAYALVRGTLLTLPLGIAGLALGLVRSGPGLLPASAPGPGALALVLAGIAFVGTVALTRAVLACYQVTVFEWASANEREAVAPTLTVTQRRRVALAGMVLVAAIAGAAVVRTADVHPAPEGPPDSVVPENATATIETATERTAARDRFVEHRVEVRNASSGRWETTTHFEALVDHEDRELLFFGDIGSDGGRADRQIYATDGRFATLHSTTPPATPRPYYLRFQRGPWSVLIGPPYGWAVDDPLQPLLADAGWRLVAVTDDRLVYRTNDSGALARPAVRERLGVPVGEGVRLTEGASATIEIDRQTLTLRRTSARVAYVDPRTDEDSAIVRQRVEREVGLVGDVDVRPPSSVPEPSALARLWDAVYY